VIDRRVILWVTLGGVVGVVVIAVAAGGMWEGWGFPGFAALWAVGFCSMGFVIDRSQPGHPVGRKLLWMGPLAVTNELVGGALQFDAAWVAYLAPLVSLFVVYISLLLHALAVFPDGEWAFPWARWSVVVIWTAAGLGLVVALVAAPVASTPIPSPYPQLLPASAADVALVIWNLPSIAIAAGVVWGFFTSTGPYRRQFGWLAFSVLVTVTFAVLSAITELEILAVAGSISVLGIPLSIAIAVTKYRLYEIDRIVSRTVTYVAVVGLLVALYFGLVLVLRSFVPVGESGPLPVALSTLAVAFAFFPLARRVQAFVDRRFFRSRYDAAAVVASFASELRSTIDPGEVVARAEAVVEETFQAESVSVWLAEGVT
jgi:hypothetical protein